MQAFQHQRIVLALSLFMQAFQHQELHQFLGLTL